MPVKKQQPLRIGMTRTSLQNGVKVVEQLQATGEVKNGQQVARWVRISPRQKDIMDLDGGLGQFEGGRDLLDMDGNLGI